MCYCALQYFKEKYTTIFLSGEMESPTAPPLRNISFDKII